MFGSEPFSHRDAWCWLIERAAWRHHLCEVNGDALFVRRGQLYASLHRLADLWGWTYGAVQRFVARLRT
ncbi:MAG TPA: hypothetical protein VMW18_14885, partial [Candidatus Binatia bacterium]|nr:hypothetical protein [Candidatus Binatia bacterium]